MARKRKTRSIEATQEPEPAQSTEQTELAPEPAEPESDQPDPEQTLDENLEAEEEEEEEGEEEDEEDENQNDAVANPESLITEKPSEQKAAVSANGCETQTEQEELDEEPIEKLLEPFSKDQLTLLIKEAAVKYPDFVESVHKLADADPSHRKIFVHGLGWEANAESLTSVFGKYGEIEDCKVVTDKVSGKSKGYGFILFKHRDGARRALKEPQKRIGNRMTSCQLASAGPVQQNAAPAPVQAVAAAPVSEYTQRKIYVSNVSAELDPKKLLEFFATFGEIEEGPLGLDKTTGKPRGFCLFVYKSLESAKKALEEPHKNFEGHTLHCQKAVDGPKGNKGGVGGSSGVYYNQLPAQQQQGYYHPPKKVRYAGSSGSSVVHTGSHLMAPSGGPGIHSAGFNPTVAPAAIGQIGQAVAALLATQGAGLGMENLLGGIGGGVNPQGVIPMMNNAGYGAQGGVGGYGGQPIHGQYGQPHMGQGGVRPRQGGAPYSGHGR